MGDLIYNLSAAMSAKIETINTISHNNANVHTPGYKSLQATTVNTDFVSQIQSHDPEFSQKLYVNDSSGGIKVTGKNFDLALTGQGWFTVEHPKGQLLTRNGNLKINPDGFLVTQTGYPVLGVSGAINTGGKDIDVLANGEILLDNRVIDTFLISSPRENSSIESVGHGLYRSKNPVIQTENIRIVQGAIELSNVDTGSEMIELMKVTRQIESLQRAMKTYDQLLQSGIEQIGK